MLQFMGWQTVGHYLAAEQQEKKGMTEDEMVEWHHRLNGHEFEQILGDGERQGCLTCCSQWVHKESHMTE